MTRKVRFQINEWSHDRDKPRAMTESHLNYFTCTLGEAARWNEDHPHPFLTVNHLIDEQAHEHRQRPALNFPGGCTGEGGYSMKSDFTYRELRDYSLATAVRLRRRLQIASRVGLRTAGLLCSSTPEFILTWLALMRLGISVVVLPPQMDRTTVKQLCAVCKISVVFADGRSYDLAKSLRDSVLSINVSNLLYNLRTDAQSAAVVHKSKPDDVAYIFHSTDADGTFTIPQTHHEAVGILPCLSGAQPHAMFSTTPLCDGGIADCLRSWASGATIHLFPGTRNIILAHVQRAIGHANTYLKGAYPVKYFACTASTLKLLVGDPSSPDGCSFIRLLNDMDLVGVDGTTLSPFLGDHLVANGVKLVSRFQSSVGGIILSSNRDYATDQEWSYLRADPSLQPDHYSFEPQTDVTGLNGKPLFELLVKSREPGLARSWTASRRKAAGMVWTATDDLFTKHSSIPNAWKYHAQGGSQFTLLNGQQINPVVIENELLASPVGRRVLEDAMVFGTGKEAPGLLLFPMWNSGYVSDDEIIEDIWPIVEEINNGNQSHAEIERKKLAIIRSDTRDAVQLPKSRRGTILREQAELKYCAEIEAVYTMSVGLAMVSRTEEDKTVNVEAPRKLTGASRGRGPTDIGCSEEQLMLDLIEKYQHSVRIPVGSFDHENERVVTLTGATESVGAHILDLLLSDHKVVKIFCLVEVGDAQAAREMVIQSLTWRKLRAPGPTVDEEYAKLVCLPSVLAEKRLGLAESDWDTLSSKTTVIIHSAWENNMSLGLTSFERDLCGLLNLLELRDSTRSSAARFVFISTSCSVTSGAYGEANILESLSTEPEESGPLGYSRSKWVAENICSSARVKDSVSTPPLRYSESTLPAEERTPIIIVRVGQLCGNKQGVWDPADAWPAMLSSTKITGCLPDIPNARLNLTPVDVATRAIMELTFYDGLELTSRGSFKHQKTPVYHVVNPHQEPEWAEVLEWIQIGARGEADPDQGGGQGQGPGAEEHLSAASPGPAAEISIVPPMEWLERLERALETNPHHPARNFLDVWKSAYGYGHHRRTSPSYETKRTENASPTIRTIEPLERDDVLRMWKWIQAHA